MKRGFDCPPNAIRQPTLFRGIQETADMSSIWKGKAVAAAIVAAALIVAAAIALSGDGGGASAQTPSDSETLREIQDCLVPRLLHLGTRLTPPLISGCPIRNTTGAVGMHVI